MGYEIDLSGDGDVLKQIVRRAKPDAIAPSDDFPVVDGILGEDGKVFDTTREDNLVFYFELDSGRVIRSWDIALKTMKVVAKAGSVAIISGMKHNRLPLLSYLI